VAIVTKKRGKKEEEEESAPFSAVSRRGEHNGPTLPSKTAFGKNFVP
jgi:hypothetical protein